MWQPFRNTRMESEYSSRSRCVEPNHQPPVLLPTNLEPKYQTNCQHHHTETNEQQLQSPKDDAVSSPTTITGTTKLHHYSDKEHDGGVDPTNPDPSIVVHVRNLNPEATEAHLLEALSRFGAISYATCMPNNKGMALVEFEELEGSRACVVHAQTNLLKVADEPALFNYSTSKRIQRLGLESEKPNHVVILTIYDVQRPINVDVIYQICKAHGEVKRIAMIRRSLLQALVEYDSIESAKKRKAAMNGADIYYGCCTLKVEFAKPDHVKVMRNDHDQWDFVTPADQLPQADKQGEGRKSLLGGPTQDQRGQGGQGSMMGAMNQNQQQIPNFSAQQGGHQASGGYQFNVRAGPNQGGPFMGSSIGGSGGGYNNQGGGYRGDRGDTGRFNNDRNFGNRGGGGAGRSGGGGDGPSCVMMVYGIDQNKINCDELFNILCLYGNCVRIKFMKSKPDTAMAQMGTPQEVFTAIDNLHEATLLGNKLALRPSKQVVLHDIRDPFTLPDNTPSFQDFSMSRNQRFSTQESAARNRIVRPTNVLHWYNAPTTMTEETVTQLFTNKEMSPPTKVTIFPNRSGRSSSGVCEFATTEEATDSLVKCNHTSVDSPMGKAPYIFKLAFAGGRDGSNFH